MFTFCKQDGQDGKKQKENHTTKVTNIIPKTKRQKYGMKETSFLTLVNPGLIDEKHSIIFLKMLCIDEIFYYEISKNVL